MALNGHNLEPEFDALLKAHVQKQGAASLAVCSQFDPETASAYLEQALSQRALTAYEEHLATCTSCRGHIIELSRLQSPVNAPNKVLLAPSLKERIHEWFSSWQLSALTGLGAVAAAILLIVFVLNRPTTDTTTAMVADNRSGGQSTPMPEAESQDTSAENPAQGTTPAPPSSPVGQAPLPYPTIAKPGAVPTLQSQPRTIGSNETLPQYSPPPAPPLPAPVPSKGEAESKDLNANQVAQASGRAMMGPQQGNLRGVTASGPEANQMQPERILELRKKDVPPPVVADAAAPASAPASAKAATKSNERSAEQVIEKPRSEIAATADRKEEKEKPKNLKQRAVSLSKPVRTKTVNGKIFRQESGVWIDERYDAGKRIPVVRLTHNSPDYQQTLKEIPGLKPYFDLQPVIVVWRGKVYRVEK